MNIWILESTSGATLVFKSYTRFELNEYLVSGLITALNQFTLSELKEPIESIDMGGQKWVYVLDEENRLLFVGSDSKNSVTEMLRARLNAIRQTFIKKYVIEEKTWNDKWNGAVDMFEPFKLIIERYYQQWTQTESLDEMADFFDLLGIFQQLLNLLNNVIEHLLSYDKKLSIYNEIESIIGIYLTSSELTVNPELKNISYKREVGFNIININPVKCNINDVKQHIILLVSNIANLLKNNIGFEDCIKAFSIVGIIDYIYNNLDMLKNLNLEKYMFQVFLLKQRKK